MRILFGIVIFIFFCLLTNLNLFSQKFGTPLEPQAAPLQTEVGILFGMGNNFSSGIYQPLCTSCQFEDAQAFGISVGGIFIRDFNSYIQYGTMLTFNSLSVNSSFQKTNEVEVWNQAKTYSEIRPIPFRNTGEFGLGEIAISPFIQWLPLKFMFLRLGIGASVLTDNNFKQDLELLKFTDTLSTGEIVDVEINDENPDVKTVEDNKIPGVNPFRFTIEPSIGFTFEVSNQIIFNPSFSYSIPLTNLTSIQEDFNMSKWRILFELRLAIKLRNIKIN